VEGREITRFDPSPTTRVRWAKRQSALLAVALVYGLVVVTEIFTTSGPLFPLITLAVPFMMLSLLVAYTSYRSKILHLPDGATWAAGGSLNTKRVSDAGLGDNLSFKSIWRLSLWTQGTWLVGCRVLFTPSGIFWDTRLTAWCAGVHGHTFIPWDEIAAAQVGPIPGAVNVRMVSGYLLELTDGVRLEGQLYARQESVRRAFEAAPI
jgi:hypothetical protein